MTIGGQSQAKFDELEKLYSIMNLILSRNNKYYCHSAIQLHILGLHLNCNLIPGLIFTIAGGNRKARTE
jgi:hypothetical protein